MERIQIRIAPLGILPQNFERTTQRRIRYSIFQIDVKAQRR